MTNENNFRVVLHAESQNISPWLLSHSLIQCAFVNSGPLVVDCELGSIAL